MHGVRGALRQCLLYAEDAGLATKYVAIAVAMPCLLDMALLLDSRDKAPELKVKVVWPTFTLNVSGRRNVAQYCPTASPFT
jgi:hypothetical protein